MPTFYIHVRKSGDELHSVNADSFVEALALYNDGAATLKQDENTEVHNLVIENIETGEKKNETDLVDAPDEPVTREYGVRLWATFHGEAETTVEATSFAEAVKKARELDHSQFSFSIGESAIEGDETAHVYGPDDDHDDDPWSGDGVEVDKRADGEPFSWEACAIVKDLAKLDLGNGETALVALLRFASRAQAACRRENADPA